MSVIDVYFNTITKDQRAELERLRQLIRSIVPDAEETISYGIPTMKYKNKYLVGFAVSKDHLSLHPTPGPIAELKDKLGKYKTSKGTIRFTSSQPLSDTLVKQIVRIRLREINEG